VRERSRAAPARADSLKRRGRDAFHILNLPEDNTMPGANLQTQAESQTASFRTQADASAPPCFNWRVCRRRAAVEKCGRSVCRECAAALRGVEYPRRPIRRGPRSTTSFPRAISVAVDVDGALPGDSRIGSRVRPPRVSFAPFAR
jgi:hypothetical protein